MKFEICGIYSIDSKDGQMSIAYPEITNKGGAGFLLRFYTESGSMDTILTEESLHMALLCDKNTYTFDDKHRFTGTDINKIIDLLEKAAARWLDDGTSVYEVKNGELINSTC